MVRDELQNKTDEVQEKDVIIKKLGEQKAQTESDMVKRIEFLDAHRQSILATLLSALGLPEQLGESQSSTSAIEKQDQ